MTSGGGTVAVALGQRSDEGVHTERSPCVDRLGPDAQAFPVPCCRGSTARHHGIQLPPKHTSHPPSLPAQATRRSSHPADAEADPKEAK